MRERILFNDNWKFIKEVADVKRINNSIGEEVTLPHTWNAIDGQDGGNDYHRGECWYVKSFSKPTLQDGQKAYLEFQGVAMLAKVYLNNELVFQHEGGYSTFRVDITNDLKEENELVVSVDNRDNHVYPQKADFTFYGGIYRPVHLIIVPENHFALDYFGTPGIKVTPQVDLENKEAVVTIEAWVNGNSEKVTFTIDDETLEAEVVDGHAKVEFIIKDVHLWDGVNDPFLYTVTATLENGDSVSSRFGCRHFEIDPQEGFKLNGKSYLLRGVSRHQDFKGVGNVLNHEIEKLDMELIKEIGATTIRLAHYQHSQSFYDLCDEEGMILWAEIPYITMHMTDGRDNTLSQMKELVVQNYNHPSIVTWGLSNEITAASTVNEDLIENHKLLNDICHKLDNTRPTVMANVFMLEIESPILEVPDINSYNLYFGWYLGDLEENDSFFDEYHTKYPDRVIGFSEYGADANPQFQTSHPEKGDYTETYQAVYHEHMLRMIEGRPWLWATHVWNMFDFAADGRDEGGKNGENQKGLVTFDRKLKKDAFYLYKAAWNKQEKFVHLCGRRYVDRAENTTEIKVYSNLEEVELYVDGEFFAKENGKTVFTFNVPISGIHTIEAKSGDCSDHIEVKFVSEPNEDYIFGNKNSVVNWFDVLEIDEDYFSVNDTMAELNEHPQAGAVVGQMMSQGVEDRGDVAAVVKDNPALQKMLNRQPLLNLLKQGRVDEESVKAINRVLQGIKK